MRLQDIWELKTISQVRVLIHYDIENLSEETYTQALTVFSEPPVDDVYGNGIPADAEDFIYFRRISPRQFDQRADSAEQQCAFFNEMKHRLSKQQLLHMVLTGALTADEKEKIKELCINPVEFKGSIQ